MRTKPISLRIPIELKEQLTKIAHEENLNISKLVLRILAKEIENYHTK